MIASRAKLGKSEEINPKQKIKKEFNISLYDEVWEKLTHPSSISRMMWQPHLESALRNYSKNGLLNQKPKFLFQYCQCKISPSDATRVPPIDETSCPVWHHQRPCTPAHLLAVHTSFNQPIETTIFQRPT